MDTVVVVDLDDAMSTSHNGPSKAGRVEKRQTIQNAAMTRLDQIYVSRDTARLVNNQWLFIP